MPWLIVDVISLIHGAFMTATLSVPQLIEIKTMFRFIAILFHSRCSYLLCQLCNLDFQLIYFTGCSRCNGIFKEFKDFGMFKEP